MSLENPLPLLDIDRHELTNGLVVFLIEDHTTPLVAVNVNYRVGSKDERPGRTGFAHLFEHMMFQGSEHFNDDYFKALAAVGGEANGATNPDRTRYWDLVPSGYLERALWLEADRMGFLLEAMTQERLDNQRSVVKNERRQSYENRPYGTVRERMLALLYPVDHPYHWPTIGSMADLDAATLDDVREFFRTFYAPNNASLCIAGDFQPARARELVERYFGEIAPGPPVTRPGRWVPALGGEVALAIQDRVQLPRTTIAWHTVPCYLADDAELDVYARILGQGRTSRLYRRLVYELGIAQDAVAAHASGQIAGTFNVLLTPRPGHTLAEVEAAAEDVLDEALDGAISEEELVGAQTALTAEAVRAMEQIGRFEGRSDKVNAYFHYLDRPDRHRWDLQRVLDLDPARVVAAARTYLGPARVIARVTPFPALSAASSEATAVDRSVTPGHSAESRLHVPARERFTASCGLPVVLAEHHTVPLLSMILAVRGGSAVDPGALPGLASLTSALLPEGAAGRPSLEVATALQRLGAELHAEAGGDAVLVSLSSLRGNLEPSLALLADAVIRPDFAGAEVERQRTRRLVLLTQLEDSPEHLARVALTRTLFGNHPYGHPALGTRSGIAATGRDSVATYWGDHFLPTNATLIAVGDTTRPELEAALARTFGAWRDAPARREPLPSPPPPQPRAIHLVDRPGSVQAVIACGLLAPTRRTEQFAAIQALNTALGGQFVSRLNLNLREDKGYTYGVRSAFDLAGAAGLFSVTTAVHTEVTAPALAEIVAELTGIAGPRPITAKELDDAKGWLVNGYTRRFETQGQVARALVDDVLYDLPDDAIERFPDEVATLTTNDVARAASAHLDTDHLAVVVVGDARAVWPELEKLGLGVVELVAAGG